MEYEVEYVELKHNEKPFENFILTLKERAKIFEIITYFWQLCPVRYLHMRFLSYPNASIGYPVN